jgi:hypothetical protein
MPVDQPLELQREILFTHCLKTLHESFHFIAKKMDPRGIVARNGSLGSRKLHHKIPLLPQRRSRNIERDSIDTSPAL